MKVFNLFVCWEVRVRRKREVEDKREKKNLLVGIFEELRRKFNL